MLSAAKMFGGPSELWILKEDKDSKYRRRRCIEWKQRNGIDMLDWPSISPHVNSIENVWARVKPKTQRNMGGDGCAEINTKYDSKMCSHYSWWWLYILLNLLGSI